MVADQILNFTKGPQEGRPEALIRASRTVEEGDKQTDFVRHLTFKCASELFKND